MEFYIVCIVVMISSVMLSFIYDIIIMIIPHLSGEGCWILCPRRTSTASSRSQWSPPDPNSNLWFKVIPARPEQ